MPNTSTTTRDSILRQLDHANPRSISALIDFHRAHFGDARMKVEQQDGGDSAGEDSAKSDDPADGSKAAPWERRGEDFDAEKAKTFITSLQREAEAEREKRRAAEAKVQEHENSKLTDQQRIEKERDDAKSESSTLSLRVAQYEAAEKAGIPLSWAKRLVGNTAEEMEADARSVADQLKATQQSGPRPDPSQGGGGDSKKSTSVADARSEYLEHRRAGNRQ